MAEPVGANANHKTVKIGKIVQCHMRTGVRGYEVRSLEKPAHLYPSRLSPVPSHVQRKTCTWRMGAEPAEADLHIARPYRLFSRVECASCAWARHRCGRRIHEEHESARRIDDTFNLSPPLASRPSPLTPRPSPLASRPSPLTSRPSPLAPRLSPLAPRPSPLTSRPSPLASRLVMALSQSR